ncbi:hypothetical protein ACFW15_14760, partial [Streptomyces sp. NPDC058953]
MSRPGDGADVRPRGEIVFDEPVDTHAAAAGAPRRRVPRTAAAGALALSLAAAAWFVFGDGSEGDALDRASASACDGLAPVPEVRAVLGSGPLADDPDRAVSEGTDAAVADGVRSARPLTVRCVITRTGGGDGEHPDREG